jgi:ABC-2 type transport system ATP-binding protein
VGIDPQRQRNILDGVKTFNQEGMTVLYTTHYMEETQELSHRIAIMDYGKVIAQGTMRNWSKSLGSKTGWNCSSVIILRRSWRPGKRPRG